MLRREVCVCLSDTYLNQSASCPSIIYQLCMSKLKISCLREITTASPKSTAQKLSCADISYDLSDMAWRQL